MASANTDTQQQDRTLGQSSTCIQMGAEESAGVHGAPVRITPQHFAIDQAADLNAILETPHQLAVAEDVSADPESLRFSYPLDEDSPLKHVLSHQRKAPLQYREQDRFVPINNVSRVMRNVIPKNGKVSKDAKECMQECVSEFISFLTSEASDRCIDEKRKTITGDDILFALSTLGFDNYVDPLQGYLRKYREYVKGDKPSTKESVVDDVVEETVMDED